MGLGGGFGTSGFGTGGFGSSSFGRGGFGSSGYGGPGGYGAPYGGSGSVFVGRTAQDISYAFGAGQAQEQRFRRIERAVRRDRRNRRRDNNLQNIETERPAIRVGLVVGFPAPRTERASIDENIRRSLARLPEERFASLPQVSLEEGVVVLRGIVNSEADRRVVETLVALEPGVSEVRNELVIAAATP
jgi:hypothetical protein